MTQRQRIYLIYLALKLNGSQLRSNLQEITNIKRTTLYDTLKLLTIKKLVDEYSETKIPRTGRPNTYFEVSNNTNLTKEELETLNIPEIVFKTANYCILKKYYPINDKMIQFDIDQYHFIVNGSETNEYYYKTWKSEIEPFTFVYFFNNWRVGTCNARGGVFMSNFEERIIKLLDEKLEEKK